ncbi:hypothetical protein [Tsuneonella dongtanensis]|uniref:hypothetical protein n=1 Tax=Tsuneonella dongtanensis TaxID=692370 RepID=UPI0018DC5161|nr:hypothetical protein [Tsuneonella dongtanensis]
MCHATLVAAFAVAGCAPQGRLAPLDDLDRFYAQHRSASGIPVVGSSKVKPEALDVAASIVEQMTSARPDLARWLSERGYRVAIMAQSEATTDLPEQAHWTRPDRSDPRLTRCERKHYDERIGKLTDRQYWDARARGMAGPLTSGAEEDLLGLRESRYWGETIFVHEFAHNVLAAIRAVDPALSQEVDGHTATRWPRGGGRMSMPRPVSTSTGQKVPSSGSNRTGSPCSTVGGF